jgi:predicted nucleotidyltransferase
MKAREGDLIEDSNRIVFDVKGSVHPPQRIVAFPRFIPDLSGNRQRQNRLYRKVYSLSERFTFLKQNHPQYLVHDTVFDETLCEVPVNSVKEHYTPIEKLRELGDSESLKPIEKKALRLVELLKEKAKDAQIEIGISGSVLAELYTQDSDIDPIVYGSYNCRRVHSALESLLKDKHSLFKPYTRDDLKALFDFRSKDSQMDFGNFARTESRKVLQGKFQGTDYFVRLVKDWSEVEEKYGEIQYRNVGHARIKATVSNDSDAIFTPCKYAVENTTIIEGAQVQPIVEITSFRGRFCEQAKKGEKLFAQGKVELVKDIRQNREYFRLLVGNMPSDFMVPEHRDHIY